MADCLISFGSNLGDGEKLYETVFECLARRCKAESVFSSSLHTTKPVGGPAGQPDYCNGAFRFASNGSADELHRELMAIERELGRERKERWGARTIDLDFLLYDQEVVQSQQLILPHPRMSFRRFVLEPAAEIASDMVHPDSLLVLGETETRPMTIQDLLNRINLDDSTMFWLTPNTPFARKVMESIEPDFRSWSFEIRDQSGIEMFAEQPQQPKLTVLTSADHSSKALGPVLNLSCCKPEEVEIEIRAALAAIG